jgi:hypothetical protein
LSRVWRICFSISVFDSLSQHVITSMYSFWAAFVLSKMILSNGCFSGFRGRRRQREGEIMLAWRVILSPILTRITTNPLAQHSAKLSHHRDREDGDRGLSRDHSDQGRLGPSSLPSPSPPTLRYWSQVFMLIILVSYLGQQNSNISLKSHNNAETKSHKSIIR